MDDERANHAKNTSRSLTGCCNLIFLILGIIFLVVNWNPKYEMTPVLGVSAYEKTKCSISDCQSVANEGPIITPDKVYVCTVNCSGTVQRMKLNSDSNSQSLWFNSQIKFINSFDPYSESNYFREFKERKTWYYPIYQTESVPPGVKQTYTPDGLESDKMTNGMITITIIQAAFSVLVLVLICCCFGFQIALS